MSRPREPIIVRQRGSRRGSWRVWLRPECGLPPDICDAWTERSLRTAPPLFLAKIKWPTTQAAANRAGLALVEYLAKHEVPKPGGPTVAEYAKLFRTAETSPRARRLAGGGRPYSPATLELYRGLIDRHIAPDATLQSLRMAQVTRGDLEGCFSRLHARVGACRTLQDVWATLHMIFAQWSDDNKATSPFRGMSKPTYQQLVRGALTEAELLAVFAAPWPSPMERAICALAFWAGLRRGEVFGLRWADVDIAGKRLVVSAAIKRFGAANKDQTVGGTKSGKPRVVPMVDYVAEALSVLPKLGERVILRAGGEAPTDRDWRNAMGKAFARAGIDRMGRNITPHSSRHSIASVLLARGVPKEYIKMILGHFDERTTDGYLHMAADEIGKIAGKLDKARG